MTAKDPHALAFAQQARAAGRSLEDIAQEMTSIGHPVTAMTLSRWLRDPAAPKEPRAKRPKATAALKADLASRKPPSDPPAAPADDLSAALDFTRTQLRETRKRAEEAVAVGNHTAAQRYGRDAAGLIAVLDRKSTRLNSSHRL